MRDLGIFIDADLVMRTHVLKTVSRCFAVLRQLRSIRHSVPATTFQTLIVSLVLSRLDYGNAVLAGLHAYLFRRLQSVMNAAARLIYGLRRSDHISDALISLHWFRAQERVRFKTAVLSHKATHGIAPSSLSQLVRVADLPGRRSLRSARTNRLLVPSVKLSTVGGRAFPVAGLTIWNGLSDNMISAPSLSTFRQRLKHFCSRPRFLTLSLIPGKSFPPPLDRGVILLLGQL